MDTEKNTPTWLDKTTGAVDFAKLIDADDGMSPLISDLQHSLHHLLADLEFGLNANRGKCEDGRITLTFQRDGIDATLWMAGIAWDRVKDLSRLLDAAQQAIDEVIA